MDLCTQSKPMGLVKALATLELEHDTLYVNEYVFCTIIWVPR